MRTAFTELVGVDHPIVGMGQVVGSFRDVRPAAEITRQIVADCEQRIAEEGLEGLL